MMRIRLLAFMLVVVLPAFAKTYKSTYSVPCTDVWSGVQEVLSHTESYNVKEKDDAKMHADYQPKHSAHVNVSGVLLQRENHVTLISKGTGCEMQVVSNYSGWEHNDRDDFKTRVDQAMAMQKNATAAKPEPEATTKP
jgi:hypothetical protein